jgi:2'-5' RNA ligase
MPRLFTALEIPRPVALQLSMLRGGLPGARWIDVENYHVTLRFIGDIDGRTAVEIDHALSRVSRPPFQLRIGAIGALGGNKPHSLYAAVEGGRELHELQAEHERILQRIGLKADPKRFVPHVTLARLRAVRDSDIAAWLSLRGHFSSPAFVAERFVLYSSRESVGGGPYVAEAVYPLARAGRDRFAEPGRQAAL